MFELKANLYLQV